MQTIARAYYANNRRRRGDSAAIEARRFAGRARERTRRETQSATIGVGRWSTIRREDARACAPIGRRARTRPTVERFCAQAKVVR